MQIIFRNVKTNQELIMPVTPSDFYVEDGRQVESLDMTDTGQVNLPGLKSLFNEQKEFLLPSSDRNYTASGWTGEPYAVVDQLVEWSNDGDVLRLLFVTTQFCALVWVFISYAIAIYSTVRLQQVQTLAELSEPAIRTILGVSVLKVVENIFEHNDGPVFGRSQNETRRRTAERRNIFMTNLYEITGNLLAAFVVGLLAYLAPKAKVWFLAKTDAATQKRLQLLVQSFARAAEQLYHDQDPAGTQRKQFVQDQLRALGVEVTEAVINMIEGAVWEINTENRKALVQTKESVSGGTYE